MYRRRVACGLWQMQLDYRYEPSWKSSWKGHRKVRLSAIETGARQAADIPHTRSARRDPFEYVEMFYNQARKHTNNGKLPSVDYESKQTKTNGAKCLGNEGHFNPSRTENA